MSSVRRCTRCFAIFPYYRILDHNVANEVPICIRPVPDCHTYIESPPNLLIHPISPCDYTEVIVNDFLEGPKPTVVIVPFGDVVFESILYRCDEHLLSIFPTENEDVVPQMMPLG